AATAPVLVVAIAKTTSSKNAGKENKAAIYDLGQAIAFLTFQAAADGLHVHQMGGFDSNALGNALHVPEGYQVQTVSAIGYIGDPEQLHPNLKAMEFNERERQPLRDMVFGKSFGETADFI
ncbi:nitroreductase family protein, partial [Arthrospira platensis SPKY1]|nr:nitroreductase family protein [Arthrospira platensis SPKY1]